MQYSGQHVPRDSWLKNLPHVKDSLHIYEILLLSGFVHYGFPELYMIVFLSINVLLFCFNDFSCSLMGILLLSVKVRVLQYKQQWVNEWAILYSTFRFLFPG